MLREGLRSRDVCARRAAPTHAPGSRNAHPPGVRVPLLAAAMQR